MTYHETTLYTWDRFKPATEVAAENQQVIEEYGPPPEDAKPLFSIGSLDGEIISVNMILGVDPDSGKNIRYNLLNAEIDKATGKQTITQGNLSIGYKGKY